MRRVVNSKALCGPFPIMIDGNVQVVESKVYYLGLNENFSTRKQIEIFLNLHKSKSSGSGTLILTGSILLI